MTESSTNSRSSGDAYRLRTFGTLALTGPADVSVLGKHRSQHRRLALLAVIAAAGNDGRSRDQLHVLFWPEASQAKARHSLEQLVYALRDSIDAEVFARGDPVRLNPSVITSDVADFRAADKCDDLERVVATYRGSFLEGFHLNNAPEFERWLEAERAGLARRYANAVERLAKKAAAERDHVTAVHWWRKAVDADPVGSTNAMGLMRALMNAGDNAAAIQFAEQYETIVAREIGTSVGPAVSSLVAEARANARAEPLSSRPGLIEPRELRQAGTRLAPAVAIQSPPSSRPAEPVRYFWITLALVVTIAAAAWLRFERSGTPVISASPRSIAVRTSTFEREPSFVRRESTNSIAAYELYLHAMDPIRMRSDSGARTALTELQQALALDPNFAAAYSGLARMHVRIGIGDDLEMSRVSRLALAEQAALHAVALDDLSGESHAVLALVRRGNYDMRASERELDRAVELEPSNPRFRELLALLKVMTGDPASALIEARRAVALDPLSPTAVAELANALLANGQCDQALAHIAKLDALTPPLNRVGSIAAQCYARSQNWPAAIKELQHVSANGGPRGQALLGYMLARGGRTAEAERILGNLLDRSHRLNGASFDVAVVYAGLGNSDSALTWLTKSIDDRSLGFEWMPWIVQELERFPRFDQVARRAGLSPGRR